MPRWGILVAPMASTVPVARSGAVDGLIGADVFSAKKCFSGKEAPLLLVVGAADKIHVILGAVTRGWG